MKLYTDSDGPSIERGVLARLKRLDAKLAVTFCKLAISQLTSRPIEIHNWDADTEHLIWRRSGTAFLYSPEYHLWLKQGSERWSWIRSYPAEAGFGHREVLYLEADAARFMRAQEILDRIRAQQEARQEKAKRDFVERQKDVTKANFSRIKRLVEDGDFGHRDAKAVSYAGQGNRGTRGQVRKDDREAGWERP
jgi:hypothetical protein